MAQARVCGKVNACETLPMDTPNSETPDNRNWIRRYASELTLCIEGFVAIGAIAVVALGLWQFNEQWKIENANQARAGYRTFLQTSLANPTYSRPDILGRPFTDAEYEQYFWYVTLMVQSFEEIFAHVPNEPRWEHVAREQFRLHCGFFSGDEYIPELYSDRFNTILQSVLDEQPEGAC